MELYNLPWLMSVRVSGGGKRFGAVGGRGDRVANWGLIEGRAGGCLYVSMTRVDQEDAIAL